MHLYHGIVAQNDAGYGWGTLFWVVWEKIQILDGSYNGLPTVCHQAIIWTNPDNKAHGANMGPIRGRQDTGGPHVGHMNFAIWECGQIVTVTIVYKSRWNMDDNATALVVPYVLYILDIYTVYPGA